MADKRQQLRQLALRRRNTRWRGYHQIGDFHDGVYDGDHVSPYTKGAQNPDAAVLILLQDWSSSDHLAGPLDRNAIEFGRTPSLPTNRNLVQLLDRFFGLALSDTYATNLFPFIKPGPMNARVRRKDLVAAAREFAAPQVSIVQPQIVVCLGLETFRAMQRSEGHPPSPDLESAIARPFAFETAAIWCQSHPGALGRANRNRGGIDRVSQDWAVMSQAFRVDPATEEALGNAESAECLPGIRDSW